MEALGLLVSDLKEWETMMSNLSYRNDICCGNVLYHNLYSNIVDNQVYFKVGRQLETHLKINQKNIHLVDNEMIQINIQKIESVWLISDCVYLLFLNC